MGQKNFLKNKKKIKKLKTFRNSLIEDLGEESFKQAYSVIIGEVCFKNYFF